MGGRLTEAQRTYERTLGKQDFRETMLSPAAQRVLDKAHGGQPAQASGTSAKTATLADIAATARSSGKTTAEVTAAMRKAGYTIGGQ